MVGVHESGFGLAVRHLRCAALTLHAVSVWPLPFHFRASRHGNVIRPSPPAAYLSIVVSSAMPQFFVRP